LRGARLSIRFDKSKSLEIDKKRAHEIRRTELLH
jgi:hypothetical protein